MSLKIFKLYNLIIKDHAGKDFCLMEPSLVSSTLRTTQTTGKIIFKNPLKAMKIQLMDKDKINLEWEIRNFLKNKFQESK